MKKEYWTDKLNTGEKILSEFKIAKSYKMLMLTISLSGCAVMAILGIIIGTNQSNYFLLFVSLAGAIFAFFYFYYFLDASYNYALTNKRILIMEGYLHTKVTSIDYTNITDIKIYETLISKLFTKTADIYIDTAGGDSVEGIFRNVQNPYEVKRKISQFTEEYRKTNKDKSAIK